MRFPLWVLKGVLLLCVYLEGEDVCDLIILRRAVRCRDVWVTAAADSGLEEHVADGGCGGPTHGAVAALGRWYGASGASDGRRTVKYQLALSKLMIDEDERRLRWRMFARCFLVSEV